MLTVSSINVLTEFIASSSSEGALGELLRQRRARAMMCQGYRTGTILQDMYNPNRFLTSDWWESIDRFLRFPRDPQCQLILEKINTLVTAPILEHIYKAAETSVNSRAASSYNIV